MALDLHERLYLTIGATMLFRAALKKKNENKSKAFRNIFDCDL